MRRGGSDARALSALVRRLVSVSGGLWASPGGRGAGSILPPVRTTLFSLLVLLPACAPIPSVAPAPAAISARAASAEAGVERDETITVAAFNIQVFGRSKRAKPEVMRVLTAVAREVDVLLVQEIRDSSEQTADIFLAAINSPNSSNTGSRRSYRMVEGPRLGRTSSKEQYAVYYDSDRVRLLDAYTLRDPRDVFEREPLVATFRAGNFDFSIVGCHIKPDDAEAELRALSRSVEGIIAANPAERDVIVLGDFNADGRYLNENRLVSIFPRDRYHVVITNDLDTMTTSNNTYDRIILRSETFDHEYVAASAEVFEFDKVFGIQDARLVRSVSDHYPVIARFRISAPDDDGR